ncbi:hypothetical protein BGZ96_001183 [Linnemannia gamsii]|uniref:Uncharacterized protein n=1 Tax=Linnemannia gamsii TaxID=64522 RepID=A0ABQ7JMN8_9FUNG|nr:hypothetical protein BGZ96_001183 [Linnemannia gamsii]
MVPASSILPSTLQRRTFASATLGPAQGSITKVLSLVDHQNRRRTREVLVSRAEVFSITLPMNDASKMKAPSEAVDFVAKKLNVE